MRDRDLYKFPFPAYPAVRIMLCIAIGISFFELFSLPDTLILLLFVTITSGWILFEFILRRKFWIISSHGATVFYSLLIIAASNVLMTHHNKQHEMQIDQSELLHLYEWEDILIKGKISESGKSSSGRAVFTVSVHQIKLPEGINWNEEFKIRLYADSSSNQKLTLGNLAEVKIRLYKFPDQRNPQPFDYGRWLHKQGITAHGELQEVLEVKISGWLNLGNIRGHILNNIDHLLQPNQSSLAKALLVGYKDDLTSEAKQQFARAGLSHIMAVSGLHVGFIVAPFWFLIPYLWGSKKGKWIGLFGLTAILILYAGVTGFSPSVSRASLMAWLLTYGRLFHKVRNSINLTAVAAIILLLIDPNQLFDVGFQLSFAAVFIILLVMPEAQRVIPDKYRFRWGGGIISIILVSIVVQIGLFPILIAYFGEFSIAGPISNALVIPLLTIVVPVGLGVVVSYSLLPSIIEAAAFPLEYILGWIRGVATFTGGNNFSFISLDEISITVFPIWLLAILTISTVRIPMLRWKMVIGLLLMINILMFESIIKKAEKRELRITFLDVGQGDAIHIKTPNDKNLLVDAGRWSPGTNSGNEVIVPYLEEKGIQNLDAIILSHPHADHIGGIEKVIESVQVDTIYQTDIRYGSELFNRYMRNAKQIGIPIKFPVAGEIIHIDPSIRIFVIGPSVDPIISNINNHSLAFKLVYGNTSALFTGDAEIEQENRIVTNFGDFLESDLYKVGHHASNTSSSEQLMDFIDPKISVASLAFENRFRHPGTETVSRLHQFSDVQNFTSLNGAIIYVSDGESFKKINWKNNK